MSSLAGKRITAVVLAMLIVLAGAGAALAQTQPVINLPDNPAKGWEVDIFGNPFPTRVNPNIGADQHWAVPLPLVTVVQAAPGVVVNPATTAAVLSPQGVAGAFSVYLTGNPFSNVQSIQAISDTTGQVVQTYDFYSQGPTVRDAVVNANLPAGSYYFQVRNPLGLANSPNLTVVAASAPPAPPACTYTVTISKRAFTWQGGAAVLQVKASATSCPWAATSSVTWISSVTPVSGTGSKKISFLVAGNYKGGARTGVISAAGQTFTITQTGK